MATLHLLSNPSAAASCLAAVAAGDAVLALADGVFVLAAQDQLPVRLGALQDDAERRGLTLPNEVEQLSYADFVDWVAAFDRSVTWR